MSVDVDRPVVAAYLAQLDAAAAAAGLAPGRRAELRAEIEAHVDDALGADPDPSDAAVAAVLDRLGPPEEIVAGEPGAGPRPVPELPPGAPLAEAPAGAGDRRWGAVEWAALALLSVGQLLPVIGPLTGVFCAWSSRRWSLAQKVVATVAGLAGLVVLVLGAVFFLASPSGTSLDPVPVEPAGTGVLLPPSPMP